MLPEKWHVGDVVRLVSPSTGSPWDIGSCGKVVVVNEPLQDVLGICFEEETEEGHDCDGAALPGHGWFVLVDDVELVLRVGSDSDEADWEAPSIQDITAFLGK